MGSSVPTPLCRTKPATKIADQKKRSSASKKARTVVWPTRRRAHLLCPTHIADQQANVCSTGRRSPPMPAGAQQKRAARAIEKCQRLIMLAHMDTAKFLCTGYCSSLQAILASSSWSMYSGHHETPDCSQPDCLASRVSEQHGSGFALAALFASILQWAARGGRGIGGNFATRCYRA